MTKYKYGNPEAPIVLIQPVGDHDLPEIEGEVAQIRKLTALDFQMIAEILHCDYSQGVRRRKR